MAIHIPRDPQGRQVFLLQAIGNNAGKATVVRHFPDAKQFHWASATPRTCQAVKGDKVVAGVRRNALIEQVWAVLPEAIRSAPFPEGSYLIRKLATAEGTVLAIIGADVAGFQFGLSDFAGRLSWAEGGLAYAGGEKLERPAMPYRYSYNWDVRTRLNPDTDKLVTWCCQLDYPHSTEFFLDNMRRVIDNAVDCRLNAITTPGLLRDEHGGVAAAQEICRYAADRGIAVIPLVGTHTYGGFYYRGNHPFNLTTFVKKYPSARKMDQNGRQWDVLCPTDPNVIAWLREGLHWLFETLDIRGVSLDGGDYYECYCPRCMQKMEAIGSSNPLYYQTMYFEFKPILEELETIKQSQWNIYGVYGGWSPLYNLPVDPVDRGYQPGVPLEQLKARQKRDMVLKEKPLFATEFPANAIAGWNISGQLRNYIPFEAFLDDGSPSVVFDGPRWPRELCSPVVRNIFDGIGRDCNLSRIKELCLRIVDGGYEGAGICCEESATYIDVQLRRLAFRHFSYHPADTLRQFARAELASRVGGDTLAERFMELLCKNQAGALTTTELKEIEDNSNGFREKMCVEPAEGSATGLELWNYMLPYRYWQWLGKVDLKNRQFRYFEW